MNDSPYVIVTPRAHRAKWARARVPLLDDDGPMEVMTDATRAKAQTALVAHANRRALEKLEGTLVRAADEIAGLRKRMP